MPNEQHRPQAKPTAELSAKYQPIGIKAVAAAVAAQVTSARATEKVAPKTKYDEKFRHDV